MVRMSVAWSIANNELPFYEGSPDAGDPACICSYCGRQITAGQVPLHIHSKDHKTEARLCDDCYGLLIRQVNIRAKLF